MKLNIVQGLYIVLRPNTNSRKIPSFHRGGAGSNHKILPRPTMYHNYILRIYLKIIAKSHQPSNAERLQYYVL